MPYPTDFKYTKEHEWIKSDGKTAGLLKKLRPELETQQSVALSAKEFVNQLKGNAREFFENNLMADPDVRLRLSEDEIGACFALAEHLKFTDAIFARRTPDPVA